MTSFVKPKIRRHNEPLNAIGLTAVSADCPMSLVGQHRFISFPKVATADSALS